MRRILDIFSTIPGYLISTLYISLLILIGIADILTGDYSLGLFYLIPISIATWNFRLRLGIVVAFASGAIRALSEYYLHREAIFQPLFYWNWSVDLIYFLVVAVLISVIKKTIDA